MSDAKGKNVSPEASQRICTHMNEDHAATVIGMALSTLNWKEAKKGKITYAKLTKVTLSEWRLSFVLCQNDVCEVHDRSLPFIPPLQSAHEVRARLTEIHDQVLEPRISWLFEPVALLILVTCCGAGLARTLDDATIVSYVESNPYLHDIISQFGSAASFPKLISFVWYVSLVGHVSEASFVAYHCQKTMKLGLKNTFMWFVLVSLVGFKVMGRFKFLLSAQMNAQETKKSNRNARMSKKIA